MAQLSGSGPLPQAQLFSEAFSTCISSRGWSHPFLSAITICLRCCQLKPFLGTQ